MTLQCVHPLSLSKVVRNVHRFPSCYGGYILVKGQPVDVAYDIRLFFRSVGLILIHSGRSELDISH